MDKNNPSKIIIFILILALIGFVVYVASRNNLDREAPPAPQPSPIAPVPTPQATTLPPQAGLPKAVEDKRQAIFKATLTRDYDRLASEASTPFSYSYGLPVDGGFAAYLKIAAKNETTSVFDLIPKLLQLPYGKLGNIYAWPAVFTKTAEEWTPQDIAQMKTLLSDAEIENYRKFGAYIFYRLGITEDGEWVYYIAGD